MQPYYCSNEVARVHVSKACTAEFSVMNMIITKVVAWKSLGGYGHLFAHFKLLPCVASCPMPNVVQFALTYYYFRPVQMVL